MWPLCGNMLGAVGSSFKVVKFEPTTEHPTCRSSRRNSEANMLAQHVAPNNVVICCVEMLRPFGLSLSKSFKPQLNDRSISAHHIPTLLFLHLHAPAKQSQHLNPTYRNIVGCNMLRAVATLLRRVVACCVWKFELVRMRGRNIVARTWPNE